MAVYQLYADLTKKVFSSLTRRSGVILYGNPAKAFLDERINTQTIPSAIIKLTEPHHGIKGEKIFTMFKNTTKGMEIFEKCSDEWIELSGKVVKDKKAEPYSGRHRCMVETFIGTNKPCEAFIDGYVQYLD